MKQLCACNAYYVEANDATYVRDGKPLCHETTCAKVGYHDRLQHRRIIQLFEKEEADEAAS